METLRNYKNHSQKSEVVTLTLPLQDDIIHYLNSLLDQRQTETQQLQQRVTDMTSRLATLPVTSSQDLSPSKEV